PLLPAQRGRDRDAAAHVLRNELQRLSTLLNEFLAFARPRPLRPWTHGLGSLLGPIAELLRPDADAAGAAIVVETPTREVWAEIDEERLRQVLINLVRNALEASARRITLRVRRVGPHAEIDVEDNGGGISIGTPIFDAFFTTKEQGTGLGLSIVHRIIDDHGGTISLRSQPGATVFTLRLYATSAPMDPD
ncbi:MAG: sensor histidine kinase, partial [Myxococcales bacterium]